MNLVLPITAALHLMLGGAVGQLALAQDSIVPSEESIATQVVAALATGTDEDALTSEIEALVPRASAQEQRKPAWRRALVSAALDPRLRSRVFFLTERLVGSFEYVGDTRAGVKQLGELRAALPALEPREARELDYLEGRLHSAGGRHASALVAFNRVATATPPMDADGLPVDRELEQRMLAEHIQCLIENGQVHYARRRAAELDHELTKAHIEVLGRRYEEALRHLDRVPEDSSRREKMVALFLRGVALRETGQSYPAIAAFQQAWQQDASRAWRVSSVLATIALDLEEGRLMNVDGYLHLLDSQTGMTPLFSARLETLRAFYAHANGAPRAELHDRLLRTRASYAQWLAAWGDGPVETGGLRFMNSQRREDVLAGVIQLELIEPSGEGEALQRVLDAEYRDPAARGLGAGPLTVSALQEQLKTSGGGAVFMVPGPGGGYVLAVDQGRIIRCRIDQRTFAPAAREAEAVLSSADRSRLARDRFTESVAQATEALLRGPVKSAIKGWTSVRFIGLGQLTSMPAAMLQLEKGQWLGCSHEVTEWPSATVALELRWQSVAPRSGPIAVVTSTGTGSSNGLPSSGFESTRIEGLFGGDQELAYVRCPGSMNLLDPRAGRLALPGHPEGVGADELESFSAAGPGPRHVILAAFAPAAAEGADHPSSLGGEGADHICHAFFRAGTRSVLASRIPLLPGPAEEFAGAYLRALGRGMSQDQAARAARVQMMEDGFHPRDVFSFALVGWTN